MFRRQTLSLLSGVPASEEKRIQRIYGSFGYTIPQDRQEPLRQSGFAHRVVRLRSVDFISINALRHFSRGWLKPAHVKPKISHGP
jgi:hypothetical protein